MGLLDGYLDDPSNIGLLSAGLSMMANSGASTTPRSLGQILGAGGLAGMQSMQQAKQQQQERALRELQMRQANLGLEKSGLEIQQYRDQTDRNKRIRERTMALSNPSASRTALVAQGDPYAPGGETSPKVGAPSWMQAYQQNGQTQQQQQSAAPQNNNRALMDRFLSEAQIRAEEGDLDGANKLYEHAAKFSPEVHKVETAMYQGQPVNVVTYKDGTQQISQYGATPKVHWADNGQRIQAIDEYTMNPLGQGIQKQQSPESAASNAVAWANHNLSKQRLSLEQAQQNQPHYMETDAGIVALPKKLGNGQAPVGVLATDANGNTLQKKQNIPQYIVEGVTNNAKTLSVIDSALKNLDTKEGRDATGYKGLLPNILLNQVDPKGVATRADIADIGSMTVHDRSGAAVTVSEFKRLAPFIPTTTDDTATVKKKLGRMRQLIEGETNNLTFAYPGAKKLADYAASNQAAPKQMTTQPKPVDNAVKFLGFE